MKCIKCGYSLDGLAAEGVCPECGLAVLQSRAGRRREPESKASRYIHTAIIALLAGILLAHLLHPRLLWYYGPTEYDQRIALVGLPAAVIGVLTSLWGISGRVWGPRLIVIILLTIALWVPIYNDFATTH